MTLADRIAVFMDGRIVQVGTPREIFERPTTAAVAAFIGTPPMNLLDAATGKVARSPSPAASLAGRRRSAQRARGVTLGVRPADLRLAEGGLARDGRARSRTSATARIVNLASATRR